MHLPSFARTVLFVAALLLIGFACALAAGDGSDLSGTTWFPLAIGGGGWLTGIDIASDDSMVVRADTYGAYIWNGKHWQQLVTRTSMPSAFAVVDRAQGVYEIKIAPSDTRILYMMYDGYVFQSTDRGATWKQTAFSHVNADPNDPYRMNGQKGAIDPINPDIVYVGTPQNGLFVTRNAGRSWQSVTDVPTGRADSKGIYPGITGIVFDPAVAGTSAGMTSTIFASSYGNGVYQSTDAGASWTKLGGGPADVEQAVVSKTGTYYAVADNNSTLWQYANGTWKRLLSDTQNGYHAVAVSPSNPSEIVTIAEGGSLNVSYDGGATWSGYNWIPKFEATDIPWLATTGTYMSIGGLVFDQTMPNVLWTSDGVGVWKTVVPHDIQWNTPIVWDDRSIGIEQLVANQVIVPPGGKPVVASWDRPFIYVADPSHYPSTYGPTPQFAAGWSLDYASSDPNFLVGIANWWGIEESGYSSDGGQTWKRFATYPPTIADGKIGGSIAASTPRNFVWVPSNNSLPYFTKDGGASWRPIAISGIPMTGETGWGWAYYLKRYIVAADRVTPSTFYLYNYAKGFYRSTDGGGNWARVSGTLIPFTGFNAKLKSVPGQAGHLFFTAGPQGKSGDSHPAATPFMRSIDGGNIWTQVPDVLEVRAFGFGVGRSAYPTIFIVGWVDHVYGIWRSDDDAQSWTKIGDFPLGSLDNIVTIDGDKKLYGAVYIGFAGSGYAYGVASTPLSPASAGKNSSHGEPHRTPGP